MALRKYPGFVGPSYTSQSKIAAYDRTVNWFVESIESGTGPARYVLYPTPGFTSTVTGLDSPGRGGLTITGPAIGGSISGESFFVSGATLYQFPSTVRGTGIVNGADHPVTIVTNGDQGHQLLFASDSTTYAYDTTSHVLTSEGTGHAVAFLNGYGIRVNQITNAFDFSAQFDFTSWDPLDTVTREDASDRWLTVLAYREELWLFGTETTSIYFNGDDADIPFQPNESAFIQMGILSPYSAIIADGAPMWLGQDGAGNGVVYRAQGYSAVRVSTHAVEFAIQSYALTNIAEACTYQMNGHVFYELTIPSQEGDGASIGGTWVYDITEGLWAERGLWNGLQFQEMDTRGYFGGFTLSRSSGTVYSVVTNQASSSAWLATDGTGQVRLRRAPHINQAQLRIRYSRFRLLMETGVGLGTVPVGVEGFDPLISLSWSDDGGQTFGSSYTVSAGEIGQFSTLVEWRQLGQARDRIFQVTCSAPVPWRLIDAFLDYSIGPS